MQKYLHMSKKSSIFASDLGIVPTITNKQYRAMRKTSKTAEVGARKRVKHYQVGSKKVIVWHYLRGCLKGMYSVTCALYPELNKLCQTEEQAIARAENIVSFHNRQLELEVAL